MAKRSTRLTKILALSAVTALSGLSLAPVAYADDRDDDVLTMNEVVGVMDDPDSSARFMPAKIVLASSAGVETIEISEPGLSLWRVLDKRGFDPEAVSTEDSQRIERAREVRSGETLLLFAIETSGTSERVEIEFPTITKKSDELFIGETRVENEGKNGIAIKTSVLTSELAKDAKVNAQAKDGRSAQAVEENLTIVEAPQARVVIEGTKERPAPVVRTSTRAANSVSTVGDAPSPQATPGSAPYDPDLSNEAVRLAMTKVGHRYVWGTIGPDTFDCSGLIYWVYHVNLGKNIPRTAWEQGLSGQQIAWEDMQPGDILYSPTHVMMYIGGGQVLHASTPSRGVVIDPLDWSRNRGYRVARL